MSDSETVDETRQSTRVATVASHQLNCEYFSYRGDSSSLGQRWENWLERFKLYLAATGITDPVKVKATFLIHMGEDAYHVFKSLKKNDDSDTLDEIYVFMTNHFVSKRSQFTEAQVFRRAMKDADETIDQYALRLRHLATHCKFGNVDEEILQQLVAGSGMENFQMKCCRTDDLDLKTALIIARGYERNVQNVNGLWRPTVGELAKTVHYTARGDKSEQYSDRERCRNCNRRHDRNQICRAKGETCRNCGKANHFASVCRSEKKQGVGRDKDESYKQKKTEAVSRVNYVEQDQSKFVVNVDEYAEFMRYKEGKTLRYELNNLLVSGLNDGPRAMVKLEGQSVDFLIDTGSPVNIVDETSYKKLSKRVELRNTDIQIFGYQGREQLPVLGEFVAESVFRNEKVKAKFIVVRGTSECLLGYSLAVVLGTIRMINRVEELSYKSLKSQYPELFSGKMGKITGVQLKLEIDKSVRPVKQKLRPIAFHLRDLVEKELKLQVEEDILERLDENSGPTEWISNLVIVPKSTFPELKIRLTSDSRAVNKAILRTRFPTKTIDDVILAVNGAKVFSKLDITKAFHQVEIAEESRNLTTIVTHIGLFRYKRLHMGVSSAAEIFAEVIREMLEDCPGCINMADDILVFGSTDKEHLENLKRVLQRLQDRRVTLNGEKCELFKTEVIFFGLKISKDGISPTEDRVAALREAKPPNNPKELHSFLSMAQYSTRFIRDFATMTEPLWKMTKKEVKWTWSAKEDRAFKELKHAISTKAMGFFNKNWITYVIVDASPVGLGAVLAQQNPNNKDEFVLIAFASRLLTEVEQRYSQCEKEGLSTVWACEKFYVFIFGFIFFLVTDNRAIQLIFNNPNSKPPARIQRWALRLMEFNYKIVHWPGKANIADFFSRQPIGQIDCFSVQERNFSEVFVNMVVTSALPEALKLEEVIKESGEDTEMQSIAKFLKHDGKQSEIPEEFRNVKDELSCTTDGIILRNTLIVVPKSLRSKVVQLAHSGHQGVVKTKSLIRSRVWFPGIDNMVERAVASCPLCQCKVPPATLMFGRATHSGIPSLPASCSKLDQVHAFARKNDEEAKARMKKHFDQVMKTRERHLEVGQKVLVKQEQKCKSDTFWDPKPLVITEINGSMVTASREDKRVTRNSSFFKLFVDYFEDSDGSDTEARQGLARGTGDGTSVRSEEGELQVVGQEQTQSNGMVEKRRGRPKKAGSDARLKPSENEGQVEVPLRKSTRLQEKAELSKAGGKM